MKQSASQQCNSPQLQISINYDGSMKWSVYVFLITQLTNSMTDKLTSYSRYRLSSADHTMYATRVQTGA